MYVFPLLLRSHFFGSQVLVDSTTTLALVGFSSAFLIPARSLTSPLPDTWTVEHQHVAKSLVDAEDIYTRDSTPLTLPNTWTVEMESGAALAARGGNTNTGLVDNFSGAIKCIGGKQAVFRDTVVTDWASQACDNLVAMVAPPGGVAAAKGALKMWQTPKVAKANVNGHDGYVKYAAKLLSESWRDFDTGLCTDAISVWNTACQQGGSDSTRGGELTLSDSKLGKILQIIVDPTNS